MLDEADIQDLRDGLADVATFAARLPRRRRRAARLPPLDPGIGLACGIVLSCAAPTVP